MGIKIVDGVIKTAMVGEALEVDIHSDEGDVFITDMSDNEMVLVQGIDTLEQLIKLLIIARNQIKKEV